MKSKLISLFFSHITQTNSSLVSNQRSCSSSSSSSPSSCLRFSLGDIKRATNKFAKENFVGKGTFGEVYRGHISGMDVAVKRIHQGLKNAASDVQEEIDVLTALHHVNIISLVGYCDSGDKKILVYEFLSNGSLYDRLHNNQNQTPRLTVEQRLEICLGVAKGLSYLHSGADFNIIHGDLNSRNVLLDGSLVPKMSSLGLSRSRDDHKTHISTGPIAGTQGYLAPEYFESNYKLSRKDDVYGFGVLLLEVLCERPTWNKLVILAFPFAKRGELPKFTPEYVEKNISPECARACEKIIRGCLELQADSRPDMNQVVNEIEVALKLQKQTLNAKNQNVKLGLEHSHEQQEKVKSSLMNYQSSSPLSSCLRFSFCEIERATNTFARENLVEDGELGKLYRGSISGNSYNEEVVVKRMHKRLEYDTFQFQKEIEVLSTARHHENIISLVGYCDEEDEKIIVYEFMPHGSLNSYLYRRHDPPPRLTVEQRLEICLGVAKGLSFFHSSNDYDIIHSDLTTDNILLDANLVPKITDFGYSSTPTNPPCSLLNNDIEGKEDYLAPQFYKSNYKLGPKADVYAFGVVLLEVLCERQAWKRLVLLALPFVMKGELPKFTPKYVEKNISPACARACEKLIRDCLELQPDKRPDMNQVVYELESALKLQNIKFEADSEQSSSVVNRIQSFSLHEINSATAMSRTLGEGGFGKVYYAKISGKSKYEDLAVKFMSTKSEEGISAFEMERKLLSACDHDNIISLVGYCDEGDEKVLVYEFMPNGSLYDRLYKYEFRTSPLTVEQRLEICLGVAKGLSYLHSGKYYNIIHSDLKTDNILLDANLVPKIADFGLSRTRVAGSSTSEQVTKKIQGTEGYIAPECYEPNYKLSRKADVYAFGVVLLEVLCEKRAWEKLVIWALPFLWKGKFPTFISEYVEKNMSVECSRACANLIKDCLENDPNNRPSMSHVSANLDLALTLQKIYAYGNNQKNKFKANNQQRLLLSDIETATNKFARRNLLGETKFGNVYRANISLNVVVKRRNMVANQEIDSFQNEIEMLSSCHHANVISLVGYCDEPYEKILVYEFMPNGSLYDYLHINQDHTIRLLVEQRLEICLGVARGLSYLHSSNIIHVNLNSENILLDRNLVAKISFGLSTKFTTRQSTSQQILYTFEGMSAYSAPEYYESNYELCEKGDVYAFGVILLEVLCEKPACKELVTLAHPFILRGELLRITPEHVETNISLACARACNNLIKDCLEKDPDKRPSVNKVVDKLELALKLQRQEASYLIRIRDDTDPGQDGGEPGIPRSNPTEFKYPSICVTPPFL